MVNKYHIVNQEEYDKMKRAFAGEARKCNRCPSLEACIAKDIECEHFREEMGRFDKVSAIILNAVITQRLQIQVNSNE